MKLPRIHRIDDARRHLSIPMQLRILTALTAGWHTTTELSRELRLSPPERSDLRRELDDLVRKGVLARAATADGDVHFGFAHRLRVSS